MRIRQIISIFLLVVLAKGEAIAASVTPIVGYIGTYSSNILRTPTDEEQEFINRPLVGVDVDHRGKNFNAYGYATAEYFDFTQGTAENETYFDVSGIANWNIIGNRFVWVLEDYASVTPLIVSDPTTPLNVEQQNILSTGPSLSTRIGDRNIIELNLRYGDFYYQLSDINNQRLYTDVSIGRQINPANNIRLGYAFTKTVYDNDYYPDYLRHDLGLAYSNRSARGELNATVGYTNTYADEEFVIDQLDGPFASLVASRQIGKKTLANVVLRSAISDSGLDNLSLGVSEVIPEVSVTPNLAFSGPPQSPLANPYRSNDVYVDLVNTQSLLVTDLRLGYYGADYQTSAEINDNTRKEALLNFDYLVRVDTLLGLSTRVAKVKYPYLDVEAVEDNEYQIGLSFTKRLFRRLDLRIGARRYVQNSNIPSRAYQETVAQVEMIYRPSGRRLTARRIRGR